jgi:hypothetical protein
LGGGKYEREKRNEKRGKCEEISSVADPKYAPSPSKRQYLRKHFLRTLTFPTLLTVTKIAHPIKGTVP